MNNATQSFLGRYRLVKVLGQGAMGVVYEAVDTRLNRTVAIKTVLRSHLSDETTATEYATRFEREAQAAARLAHPNVVTVYDFGEHEDISYIVMEFIRGRELNHAFEANERFELPEAIRMMRELLAALDYAHQQGIVHRDIKPANVMLDHASHVKLTDFGVARVANTTQDRTMPGTLVGTPSYMSPEQILGLAVGSRADIFAAGVILYQFLTGKRPFSGGGPFGVQRKIVQDDPELPSKLNPELPEDFDLIVAKALAKQPENRYETARQFADDLARVGNTLARTVPMIDLELGDEPGPEFSPAAPTPHMPPVPPVPGGTLNLRLDPAAPFGGPPPVPVAPPPAGELPFDAESTVLMRRPPAPPVLQSAPPPTMRMPPRPPSTSPASGPFGSSAPSTSPPAPAVAHGAGTATPRNPPETRGADPRAVDPRATANAGADAPHPPTIMMPPRPGNAAAAGAAAATRRAPPAAPPPAPRSPGPSLMPVAAGAGVAVLVLAGWLLIARPWSQHPAETPSAVTPTPVPPAHELVPAESPAPSPAPAPAPATAAEPAPAPTPAPEPQPAVVHESPPPVVASPPAPAPAPAAIPPARRVQTDPRPIAAPRAEPRSGGLEPRCSDLLQRMQLGEPLTSEQSAYFQTRCTR